MLAEFEEADKLAHQTLVQRYLKKYNHVIEAHARSLMQIQSNGRTQKMESNEGELQRRAGISILSSFRLAHHVWDIGSDPIEVIWGPLAIDTQSYEELITSSDAPLASNQDVPKVLLVLCSIANQLKEWRDTGWEKYVYQLILYGDGEEETQSTSSVAEGKGHLSISKFLPLLYDLDEFAQNCVLLIANCMQQLGSLFKDSKPHVVSVNGLHFPTVFLELANLLGLLVILDEVIANQLLLQEHWTKYRRMIKSVRADSQAFATESSSLLKLEKELSGLNQRILSGKLFYSVLNRVRSEVGKNGIKSAMLTDKVTLTLTLWSENLEKDFKDDILRPVAVSALFAFTSFLLPHFDGKKLFQKTLWEQMKKIPAVPIAGSLLWIPETFFNSDNILPTSNVRLLDAKALQNLSNSRHLFLTSKVQNLFKEVWSYHFQVGSWATKLQETFYAKERVQLRLEDLSLRYSLLSEGIKMSKHLNQNFKLILNLHAQLGRPVTKQTVALLCRMLQLLKTIQSVFHRFNVHVCETGAAVVQNVMHIALRNVHSLKNHFLTLKDPKRVDETRSDTLAVLAILENVMKASPTQKRLLLAKLAFEWVAASHRLWREEDTSDILAVAIDRIVSVSELQQNIRELCDGSSFYFHRVILSSYFSSVYSEFDATKLSKMFLVLNDCVNMLGCCDQDSTKGTIKFVDEVKICFRMNLVEKLIQDMETNLRLASHSHLKLPQQNTSDDSINQTQAQDYTLYLEIPSLLFNGHKFNLKFMAEQHLSRTFYNLASVALHDWNSYANMRVLAVDKYNFTIQEDHLPGHTLEQGLDLLEIVRNLAKFVTEFCYNLNNQVFVQVSSQNKHLDTVNIRHLANSMRTHGQGLIATIVNSAYQFLRVKVHSFSQFLYDEQIKSRLAKEIRIFKQGRQTESRTEMELRKQSSFTPKILTGKSEPKQVQSFSYDRVLKFQRGIRKLGLAGDGLSLLDQFRILITQIGNALGFVRLVRSGQLHFLAGFCRFVPEMDDLPSFKDMCGGSHFEEQFRNEEMQCGGANIDSSLQNLSSVMEGADYLRLLANGFSGPCRNESNAHLKNFYAIVPALTVSYVDHIRSCKEKLVKKTQNPTTFTEDGFPMGVAFFLNVLGQDQSFDSLQWFAGLTQRLAIERQTAETAIQESKRDEKLQQANILTIKRLQESRAEFDLLHYNLSSARIFFQQNQVGTNQ